MQNNYSPLLTSVRYFPQLLLGSLGFFSLAATSFAAPATEAGPAQPCLKDLSSFSASMSKDGYWIDDAGYGFPVYGYGYGGGYAHSEGYGMARPGYEVRTLVATARILAHRGDQPSCENVLGTAREMYSNYVAELRKGKIPPADVSDWRRMQIETAVAVSTDSSVYRSDQLIGTSIVNVQNVNLGSVEDIVLSPQTGKIVYLVVGHGGFWGIDEQYSPVPWADFKSTPGGNLLVLPITSAILSAAPKVQKDQSDGPAAFALESHKVDSFWAAHPPVAMN